MAWFLDGHCGGVVGQLGHVTKVTGASGIYVLHGSFKSHLSIIIFTIYVNYHVFPYFSHALYSFSVSIIAIYLQSFVIYVLVIHALATHCALYSISQGSHIDAVSP
jgi:hypothetical protein